MRKLICCFRRKAGISVQEFQSYWLEDHGGLALRLREDLSAYRYTQSHTIVRKMTDKARAVRQTAEPFDGIAEAWFQDEVEIKDVEANRKALAQMVEDEAKFIDFKNSVVFYTEEHQIF